MQKQLHDPKPKPKPKPKSKTQSTASPASRSRAVTQTFVRDEALQRASGNEPAGAAAGSESPLEGEGSYTSGRRYDKAARDFAGSGAVEASAREAQRAVDGPQRQALTEAEHIGKRGGRDPQTTRR